MIKRKGKKGNNAKTIIKFIIGPYERLRTSGFNPKLSVAKTNGTQKEAINDPKI